VQLGSFAKPAPGWHFLCDKDGARQETGGADRLSLSVTTPKQAQFAHAAAIFILTPEGRIARYLYGVRFRTMDMRFALAEAAKPDHHDGRKNSVVLLSNTIPASTPTYLFATNFMRAGGALTVLLVAFFLYRMCGWRNGVRPRFRADWKEGAV